MADPGALRVRRARAHKAGDHRLCKRCAAVRGEAAPVLSALPALAPDARLDPAAELAELAAELHAAYRADTSNAILARELRATLVALMPKDSGKRDADLTGLFAALQA